jgi:hypothetical protein
MCTLNQCEHSNKPFSQRLIEDLRTWLETAFLANGLHMVSVEMDPVEDEEELEAIFGAQLVFTIRATAYICSPKGGGDNNVQEENGGQL